MKSAVFAFSRTCVRESITTISAERSALESALGGFDAGSADPESLVRPGRRLAFKRSLEYLQYPAPIPVPPAATADLRREAAGVVAQSERSEALLAIIDSHELEMEEAVSDLLASIERSFSAPDDPERVLRRTSAVIDRILDMDERAVQGVADLISDPERIWYKAAFAARYPCAKEALDALVGVSNLNRSEFPPECSEWLDESQRLLQAHWKAMRTAIREMWRTQIVKGAQPSSSGHQAYRAAMRSAAGSAQSVAVAMVADLEQFAAQHSPGDLSRVSRAAREAVHSVVGTSRDFGQSAQPINAAWPPPIYQAFPTPMLRPR